MWSDFLVDLSIEGLPGFRSFIGAWVGRHRGLTYVVDPGPMSTLPLLLKQLEFRGIQRIDVVLLTHIHVDHAGGVGALSQQFPELSIVVHPRSIPHLVKPDKLIASSHKVLGELMQYYGPILPVAEQSCVSCFSSEWEAIASPGHSPDHISYVVGNVLYCGEALGVVYPGAPEYLRPATPPRFFLDAYVQSIKTLQRSSARVVRFGHFGEVRNEEALYERSLCQVDLWERVLRGSSASSLEQKWLLLCEQDPFLSGFNELPEDVKARERRFLDNSIKGIVGYLEASNVHHEKG